MGFRIFSYLAVAAAFILLACTAIGPFTQQSVKSYACQRPLHNMSASLAAANRVDSGLNIGATDFPSLKLMAAVMEGIMGLENNSRTVPFDCPTGTCDFSHYSSLGYCSSCVDISSRVQERYGTVYPDGHGRSTAYGLNYTLPGEDCEIGFTVSDGKVSSFEWYIPNTNARPQGGYIAHLVLCPSAHYEHFNFTTFFLIWSSCSHSGADGSTERPNCPIRHLEQLPSLGNSSSLAALTCTLGLCVRDYTGRVRNGILDETMTNSFPPSYQTHNSESTVLQLPCIVDSQKYDASNVSQVPSVPGREFTVVLLDGQEVTAPLECVFTAGPTVTSVMTKLFNQIFASQVAGGRACSADSANDIGCDPWYLESMFRGGKPTVESVSSGMDRFAIAISNVMRAVGTNAYKNGSGVALGTVMETTVCLRVEWPWLLFPAALLLLTVLLFVAVFLMERKQRERQPVWKSSAVVAFFHGIDARLPTPDPAGGKPPPPVTSSHDRESLQASSPLLKGQDPRDLMTLESMHARAEKVVVKLETVAVGQRGFVILKEEDGDRAGHAKSGDRRGSTEPNLARESLPRARLPSNSSPGGQFPKHLHVDLGPGFTPSVRSSLDRSTLCDGQGSPEQHS
jgi:hypothetical protein